MKVIIAIAACWLLWRVFVRRKHFIIKDVGVVRGATAWENFWGRVRA